VSLFSVGQRERAGWQRRAVAELTTILDVHRDLPGIAWTIAAAGATLIGHVNGPSSAGRVRQVFDLWRAALTLTEHTSHPCGGTVFLRAVADRNRVRVRLTATLVDDEDTAAHS
jgi:hypothetical protein